MKEIFANGGEADVDNNNATERIEFSRLRSLSLGNLPEVTSFFREVKTPSASPHRRVPEEELTNSCSNEINLDSSTQLFNEKVDLPNLEALELCAINVDKIWHYNHLPFMLSCFQSLTRLIVRSCHKLKYIFSASMIQSFELLRELSIADCRGLREIISKDRADHVTPCFVFPQMTTLRLEILPELKSLYPGIHTSEWPALKTLYGSHCDQLKIFAADLLQNNGNDQIGISAQQPLFLFEKVIYLISIKLVHKQDIFSLSMVQRFLGSLQNRLSLQHPPIILKFLHYMKPVENAYGCDLKSTQQEERDLTRKES
ncbi:hypothetical protein WN944_006761 [Citrus x changshan-huyou]|uniref:Disease resistance protein At4g27190-like leucine-rich repeats domain-containing protein n=1 Tax=Citrus x changshan-huyou TaxID=2935761 RepID=A0AAP0MME8_9ROSI